MPVLRLSESLCESLVAIVRQGYPEETCGLLLGTRNGAQHVVVKASQARNLDVERAGDRYALDPQDFLAADREARAHGLDIVGIWHSHPDHPARPSAIDLASAWPDWSYLIVAIDRAGAWDIRSWALMGDGFEEEEIKT